MLESRRKGRESVLDSEVIVQEICKYIKSHLDEELSYRKLEEKLYVSRYHLSFKFREITGMTLTNYVIHQRLLKTVSLVEAGVSLEDASLQCGFNTYSHFYKKFVQTYGVSPRAYFKKKK